MTSFAVVLVFGIFRKRKWSKANPRSGASTTTEMTKASQIGRFSFWTSLV